MRRCEGANRGAKERSLEKGSGQEGGDRAFTFRAGYVDCGEGVVGVVEAGEEVLGRGYGCAVVALEVGAHLSGAYLALPIDEGIQTAKNCL